MKFQVRLTAKAEQDVESVLIWFQQQDAASAGSKWFARLMTAVARLEKLPTRCGLAAEAEEIGEDVRELRIGKGRSGHRLLFRIEDKTVHILRVWHSARDAVSGDDL